MEEDLAFLRQEVSKLASAIDRLSAKMTEVFGTNKLDFKAGSMTVATAGTPEQMPSVRIPVGHSAYVVAKGANTGVVYFATEDVIAATSSLRFELSAKEGNYFRLDNLDRIWLDVSVGGEGINWYVEQE